MGSRSRTTVWLGTATLIATIGTGVLGTASSASAASVSVPAATIVRSAPQLPARVVQVNVRTRTTDANYRRMQAAVDAGGQVAITYRSINRTIVSAHDYSDATALSLHKGDLVRFGGKLSGVYRVTGAIRVSTGSSAAQVLALKSKVMMQTCVFGTGKSRIVGLAKVVD